MTMNSYTRKDILTDLIINLRLNTRIFRFSKRINHRNRRI